MISNTLRFFEAMAIGKAIRQLNGSRWNALLPQFGRPEADWPSPVEMFSVTLPVPFADTASLKGLKPHEEFTGSEPHENVNVPDDPLAGVKVSVYVAVCPLDTVLLDWPEVLTEKSKPIPDSAT